jgi:hypothetical protein
MSNQVDAGDVAAWVGAGVAFAVGVAGWLRAGAALRVAKAANDINQAALEHQQARDVVSVGVRGYARGRHKVVRGDKIQWAQAEVIATVVNHSNRPVYIKSVCLETGTSLTVLRIMPEGTRDGPDTPPLESGQQRFYGFSQPHLAYELNAIEDAIGICVTTQCGHRAKYKFERPWRETKATQEELLKQFAKSEGIEWVEPPPWPEEMQFPPSPTTP